MQKIVLIFTVQISMNAKEILLNVTQVVLIATTQKARTLVSVLQDSKKIKMVNAQVRRVNG